MKFLCRAFCALLISVSVVWAQYEDEETFGDYQPTLDDDLIQYVPKYTVRLGFRGITGVTSEFAGAGTISPPVFTTPTGEQLLVGIGEETGVANRVYHDGYVGQDRRTVTDPAGNQIPIADDGRTNNWTFTDAEQATEDGLIALHTYSATLTDPGFQEKKPPLALGVELAVERDFGKLLGTRMQWGMIAGMSVNQFNAIRRNAVNADITTITDYYSLNGQAAPEPGTVFPTSQAGVDTSTLLGSEILARTTETQSTTDLLTTRWQSRGAYVTLRAGPTLLIPIGQRFSASFSAGAVIVYAGSTYSITQFFEPETGDPAESFSSDDKDMILPGFFVDANLQWAMTETAGLYVGAVYQSSGDYTQTVTSDDQNAVYRNRVDLSKLQGFRAGMNFRF